MAIFESFNILFVSLFQIFEWKYYELFRHQQKSFSKIYLEFLLEIYLEILSTTVHLGKTNR